MSTAQQSAAANPKPVPANRPGPAALRGQGPLLLATTLLLAQHLLLNYWLATMLLHLLLLTLLLRFRPNLGRWPAAGLVCGLLCVAAVAGAGALNLAVLAQLVLPLTACLGLAAVWPRAPQPPSPVPPVQTGTVRAASGDPDFRSEELFRRIFESSQIGIAIVGRDQQFARVNPTLPVMLGYSEVELRGHNLRSLTHPDDGESVERSLAELLKGHVVSFQRVLRCVRRDCKIIWVHLSASVVRDENGEVLFGLAMFDDVTERRRVEERLRQREAEYAHATRLSTVGEMATGLAHELNQPLAAITNYAEACQLRVRHGEVDRDALLEDLEQVAGQAGRASEIIRRLRSFLRKREAIRVLTNVNDIVREVIEFNQFELRSRSVELRADFSDELPELRIDRIQIQQVLVNLVRNAMDSMNDTPAERRRLVIRTESADDSIIVSVRDQGRGLPPGVNERLFRPFFSTKASGLGVGLSISRTIVESHEGKLWAVPNQDAGTCFFFSLPRRNLTPTSTAGDPPPMMAEPAPTEKGVESHLGPR